MEKLYKVKNKFMFNSNIKVKIPIKYSDDFFDEIYNVLEEVNKKYNSYSENSYIDKINKNSGNFVEVDDETIFILEKIKYFSEKLNGEYDITIMPLIKVWGFYKKNINKIPSNEELEKVSKLVDYTKIIINKKEKKVKIDYNQEIITGSFIKSYAIDKALEVAKKMGIDELIINAGGE